MRPLGASPRPTHPAAIDQPNDWLTCEVDARVRRPETMVEAAGTMKADAVAMSAAMDARNPRQPFHVQGFEKTVAWRLAYAFGFISR